MPDPVTSGDISVSIPPHHPQYYLPGGDLHVIAGSMHFRVHGYFFSRDSNLFNTKLNPASPGQPKEGTNDSPVVLDGVSSSEFEKLLWVFYNPKYSLYDAEVGVWRTILNLAHSLEFKEVKELAVRELHMKHELPLVEKMALYQEHKVDPRHLVPLFAELCSRDTPLTLAESKILGPESTHLVYSTRERLRAKSSDGNSSPLPSGVEEKDVFNAIESFLNLTHGSTLLFHENTTYRPHGHHYYRGSRGKGKNGRFSFLPDFH